MNNPVSHHPQVAKWLEHIRALSVDIGPRGPTRPGERQGAEYAKAQLEKMGLQPVLETFASARSIFYPHILGSALILLAFIGLGTVIQLVTMNTMIQVEVPNELRGRVFSIYFWALQGVRSPARSRQGADA